MTDIQIKAVIEDIASETNSQLSVDVWQDWICDIASAKSLDRIIFDKETLLAYWGCSSQIFLNFCEKQIKELFYVYIEDFNNGLISWSEIDKFRRFCNDVDVLNEINRLAVLNKDLNLLRRFIADYEKGAVDSVLIDYLRQSESGDVKVKMLEYLKKRQVKKHRKTKPVINHKQVIQTVTDTYKQELGEFLLVGYNRNEILRQYGLEHLIDKSEEESNSST